MTDQGRVACALNGFTLGELLIELTHRVDSMEIDVGKNDGPIKKAWLDIVKTDLELVRHVRSELEAGGCLTPGGTVPKVVEAVERDLTRADYVNARSQVITLEQALRIEIGGG